MTPELDLLEIPSRQWLSDYEEAASTSYMRKKYNRAARLKAKADYIEAVCPFVKNGTPGVVFDIGPGPGEFLELCLHSGCPVMGVEPPSGEDGMGDDYWNLSRLMHHRQRLPVSYTGWQSLVGGDFPGENSVALFNSQGSWAQSYSNFLTGEPHHVNHDAKAQRWRFCEELAEAWAEAFIWMRSRLIDGGSIIIYDNATGTDRDQYVYQRVMQAASQASGLIEIWRRSPVFACWRK